MSIPLGLIGALLTLCLRFILGGVFLFGGVVKLNDRRALDHVLRSLVKKERLRPLISFGLPLLEAVLGTLLLFHVSVGFITSCMLLLLLLFSAVLLYGWRTKKLEECGCTRTPLPPEAALVRNGVLLALGGIVLWHPDPSFSSLSLLVEGAVALFIALVALRGNRRVPHVHQRFSARSGPSRRSLLRRGLALGTALALPFLHPGLSLACECDCIIDEYDSWGDCICGIQALYHIIIWCCCETDAPCDVWSEVVSSQEC